MPEVALDVVVLWGRDVLTTRQLVEGDEALIGDGAGALAPLPFGYAALDDEDEGGSFVFGHVDGARAYCRLPGGLRGYKVRRDGVRELLFGPQSVRVLAGEEIRVPLGAITLVATGASRASLPKQARPPRRRLPVPTVLGAITAVALAHVGLLTLGSVAEPASRERTLALETAVDVRMLLAAAEADGPGAGFGPEGPGETPLDEDEGEDTPPGPEPAETEAVLASLPPAGGGGAPMCRAPDAAGAEAGAGVASAPEDGSASIGFAAPATGFAALLGLGLLGFVGRGRRATPARARGRTRPRP